MANISEFYNNKSIFITGATGFMGKVLVEKLLRDCEGIKKIYLLIRPKKGFSSSERLQTIKDHQAFEYLRQTKPQMLDKLRIVSGDISMDNLGISEIDRKELTENVNIIFHSAATVKFDLPVEEAILINLFGTYEVVKLAQEIKKLDVLVHVSTLFCLSSGTLTTEEAHYPVLPNVLEIIQNRSNYSHILTPDLIKRFPNSYNIAKSLAEDLLNEYKKELPIAIARPAIIISSTKQPYPGYIEGIHGATGIMMGLGKGLVRSLYCDPDSNAQFIPVDLTINCLIAMAWKKVQQRDNELFICNISTADINSKTWHEHVDSYLAMTRQYPMENYFFKPASIVTMCFVWHLLHFILFQFIPAIICDFGMFVTGKKPFLIKTQKRIFSMNNSLFPFISKRWDFKTKNFQSLYQELSDADKKIFYFDVKTIDWEPFTKNSLLGIKKFILKEDLNINVDSGYNV